ncbi:PTS glucose transporter subunit IIA [Kytococcus sedentarius]|uniref:PTS glucose transporter subunit IIA n=1 Tax=Kytococcus sedentarius TaxID=1276 RepID=UPI00387932B9
MTDVLAPCAGTVLPLAEVPDQVFATQMVGAGVAVDPLRPEGNPGRVTVVSPLAGTLLKVHPHAFVVMGEDKGVLVHLGIDTVQLEGEGFEVHVAEKDTVAAGDPIVSWDPAAVDAGGRSALVPVVVMDSPADSIEPAATGEVTTGQVLFAL